MTHPSRVVDAGNQGWYAVAVEPDRYEADYGLSRGLTPRALADIPGPWRPVLPVSDADEHLLGVLFRAAGRATVTTIASALEEVFHQLREQRGGLRNANESFDYAMRTLTAGQEGSWESAVLKEIVLFGNELNLAPPKRNLDNSIEARRARGPSRRVNRVVRGELVGVLTRWTSDPARYIEVADTLACAVSQYADNQAGADGWRAVADQWLQPGSLAVANFISCYRLLYGQSAHYDQALLNDAFLSRRPGR